MVSARQSYNRMQELLQELPNLPARMRLPDPIGHVAAERLVGVPPGAQVAALKGVSFEIEAGEAVGVIGPTGAGKSTLARLLVGIWPPYGGICALMALTWGTGHPRNSAGLSVISPRMWSCSAVR